MKKKTNMKTVIRKIVREEVALAIQEVITELREPQQPVKPIEKKQYTNNSVLNDILNETAMSGGSDDWKTLGDSTYTSDRINEVVGGSYADMMNGDKKPDADTMVKSMGGNPDAVGDTLKNALTRDYSDLMKAMDKKQGK